MPALACLLVAGATELWWPATLGAAAGGALAWPLLRLQGRPEVISWTGRLLLAAALLIAAAPGVQADPPAPAAAVEVAP